MNLFVARCTSWPYGKRSVLSEGRGGREGPRLRPRWPVCVGGLTVERWRGLAAGAGQARLTSRLGFMGVAPPRNGA